MKGFWALVFTLLFLDVPAQTIQGLLRDSNTKEALAFVSVSIVGRNDKATMSNIHGQFEFKDVDFPCTLRLSYIGYQSQTLELTQASSAGKMVIELKPSSMQLREVLIRAGENPAHRIIRETWRRRAEHDPEALPFYSCSTYNKLVLTGKPDTGFVAKTDEDRANLKSADSLFGAQHLFMIESSNKRYRLGGRVKEDVLGSKVSGMKEASFFMLALKFQPFTFYEPLINLSGIDYLNPISRNSEASYSFQLEDTLFNGKDTTYRISFRPKPGKVFDGLKGMLYISAPDYAISHVIADPISEGNPLKMNIRQQYKRNSEGVWFPEQIITTLHFTTMNIPGYNTIGESETFIQDVDLKTSPPKSKFDEVELEVSSEASNRDTLFWSEVRIEELSAQEKETYRIIDSLFKAERIEPKMKAFEALVNGFIPIRWFNLEFSRVMRFNNHEGFRLGAGGITNDKLSKHFGIGGFYAYGFKDKVSKYGAEGRYYLYKKKEVELRMSWSSDVAESGLTRFKNERRPLRNEQVRNILVSRMDAEEITSASIAFRAFHYLHSTVFVDQVHLRPTYGYQFSALPPETRFSWLETGVCFVYSFRQKFFKTGNFKMITETPRPVYRLQIAQGKDLNGGGSRDFTRIDLRVEHAFPWRRFGKTFVQMQGGLIQGTLPYAKLFNTRGNFQVDDQLRVSSSNTFETVRMNEFVNDRYAALFLQHDLGRLFQIKSFKPTFILVQNVLFGQLSEANRKAQSGILVQDARNGVFESGLVINTLVKIQTGGYGLGGFYRYGPNSNADWKKNVYLKLSLTLAF